MPVLRDLPDAALVVDDEGRVVTANALARGVLAGLDEASHAAIGAALALPAPVARVEVRRHTGVPVLFDLRFGPERDGRRICLLRELNHADLAAEAQRHFDVAFDASPVGMAIFNADGEYVRVNDALCAMLDRPREQLLGSRDRDLTHPDDREQVSAAAWRILEGEQASSTHEQRFLRPDGSIVWVIANAAFLRDDVGRPLSWVCQFVDITARREAEDAARRQEAELERLARHDVLTGLLNRRAFEERLAVEHARAARQGAPMSLVLLDIDAFKAINDRFGHPGGDGVLRELGRRLTAVLRRDEPLARIGGEEFAWILPATTAAVAVGAAERARRAIGSTPFDGIGWVSVSAGVCGLDEAGWCPQELYRLADLALYDAKGRGGDTVAHRAPTSARD